MRIIIVLLFISNTYFLFSQSNTYNTPKREFKNEKQNNTYLLDNDTQIGITMTKLNASSYFDMDNNIVTTLVDTNYMNKYDRIYTFELEQLTLMLSAQQKIFDNLMLQMNLPISHYSLNEKYGTFYDSTSKTTLPKQDKANYSLFVFDYLETNAIYSIFQGQFDASLSLAFRLPFGGEYGVARNQGEFWSNNSIELQPNMNFAMNFEKFNVALSLGYNHRTEDLKDEFISELQIGLYSIPDTYISANLKWATPIISFDNALPFSIRNEPNMENYLQADVLCGVLLSEDIGINFSYTIKLLGRNSWNYYGYNVGLFYNL
ncbi:MAG TPA: hypothetical protein PLE30_07730 [Candidatus Kapabacteria bacterium]|nr:hypothetical protein [Candidatus Kapabacteria bacterium]